MCIGLRVMLTQAWRRVRIGLAALRHTLTTSLSLIPLNWSKMAPAPNDKSDSTSETPTDVAAGYLGVIILSLLVILLFMLICAILKQYV